MANCEKCKEARMENATVNYYDHQQEVGRWMYICRKLILLIVVETVLCVILACIAGYMFWYESQFEEVVETTTETFEVTADQQTEDGNNYIVGGDVIGG